MQLIIDVRTREEFVKEHIKGALNIPHYDLQFHEDFLKEKDILPLQPVTVKTRFKCFPA